MEDSDLTIFIIFYKENIKDLISKKACCTPKKAWSFLLATKDTFRNQYFINLTFLKEKSRKPCNTYKNLKGSKINFKSNIY
jgi:hypothetical protein